MFCYVDIKTKGLSEFNIKLDQQLENCDNFLVVTSLPMENNLPLLEDKHDLSTHHKYLLDFCKVVSRGNSFEFHLQERLQRFFPPGC